MIWGHLYVYVVYVVPYLLLEDHSMLCWEGPWDGQGRAWQGHIGQSSLPHPTAVVGDFKSTSLMVVQTTT